MQEIVCHICSNGEDEAQLLLCDRCNRGFHTFCLNIRSLPTGSWYCPGCARSMTAPAAPVAAPISNQVNVYVRVSSKGQNAPEIGRVGMDTQNVKILEFCMANNLYVKSTVTEVGSAYRTSTPKLKKLIEETNNGTAILIYSISRFSRNVEYAKRMVKAIHEKGSFIWSVMDHMDSRNPDFMNLVQAAENESRNLGERILAAQHRVRTQGGWVGRKPFGYNKVRVDGMFRLQENRLEQTIIKRIRELAEIYPVEKVLAIAKQRYNRFNWTKSLIQYCVVCNHSLHYQIIPAAENDVGMEEMFEAIDEVEEPEAEAEAEGEQTYIVKRLLKIRYLNGVYQILVKWKDFRGGCTWESLSTLYEDAADLVEEFFQRSRSTIIPRARAFVNGETALQTPIKARMENEYLL